MTEATSSGAKGPDQLRRNALGVAAITFFVVSAAAPLTAVVGGYPVAMLFGNSAGVPLSVVVTTLILLLFSVGYTAMARHIANAGSFFAFTAQGMGGLLGGAAAYIAVLAYNCMQIGLYGLFGVVATGTFAEYGLELDWWIWSAIAWVLVAIFGYLKIDLSAKVLAVLVVLESLAVLLLDVTVIGDGGADGLSFHSFSLEAFEFGSPIIGVLLCFAAFMGFEATTIYSEEAKDPARTVPRATYLAVLLIGAFYTVSTWVMVEAVPDGTLMDQLGALPDPVYFIFIQAETYVGPWLSQVMGLLVISSVFAALLAFHNAAARYFYVLGREGLLPGNLGQTHDEHESPHLGSVLQTVLALVVGAIFVLTERDPFLDLFVWLTNTATLGLIILMALASFSVVLFFGRNKGLEGNPIKSTLAPLAAGVVLTGIAYMVVTNFVNLTGASETMAMILPALVGVAAVLGLISAALLKGRDPKAYAELGAHRG